MATLSPIHQTFLNLKSSLPPHAWEAFVKDFASYADEITVAVTTANFDRVLNAQGHAQQVRLLLKVITECQQLADRQQPMTPIQR